MGACLSKKKKPLAGTKSATTVPAATVFEWKKSSGNGVTVSKPRMETEPEKKENKKVQESAQEHKAQVKREIFIIKHRKSHDIDDREKKNSKGITENDEPESSNGGDIEAAELMGMKTSSCTKEEVDAILIHCGRLSRNSSGKAASFGERGRRFSGSKRSQDFDNCDTISTEKHNVNDHDWMDVSEKRHRQSPRSLSADGERRRRRRTPSREREEMQRSSSRERRVSRSPVRRSSDTNTPSIANARNNKPGKMVSVPATVSSLVMDKSNNNGGGGGGGEFAAAAAATSIQRITVRRNVGAASPRSQSPARPNGNAANQLQPSLSRNNSRKAEQSPQRRIPLSEVEPNSLAFPLSTTNNNNNRVQSRPKKEIEAEANQVSTYRYLVHHSA